MSSYEFVALDEMVFSLDEAESGGAAKSGRRCKKVGGTGSGGTGRLFQSVKYPVLTCRPR